MAAGDPIVVLPVVFHALGHGQLTPVWTRRCANASSSARGARAARAGREAPGERAARCPAGREGRRARPLARRGVAGGRPLGAGHSSDRPGPRRSGRARRSPVRRPRLHRHRRRCASGGPAVGAVRDRPRFATRWRRKGPSCVAGGRRGDLCRPFDWIPEVHHSLGGGEAVIPGALLCYRSRGTVGAHTGRRASRSALCCAAMRRSTSWCSRWRAAYSVLPAVSWASRRGSLIASRSVWLCGRPKRRQIAPAGRALGGASCR